MELMQHPVLEKPDAAHVSNCLGDRLRALLDYK